MRISGLCTVFAVLLAAAPASADKQRWGFVRSDRAAVLFFGVPESEEGTLYLVCEPSRKSIAIITRVMPRSTRHGRPGKIKLSNGSSSLEFAGKTVQANEDAGVHFEASTAIDPRLFELLETGTSLRIESLGARESVPLRGVKGPLGQMRKACR